MLQGRCPLRRGKGTRSALLLFLLHHRRGRGAAQGGRTRSGESVGVSRVRFGRVQGYSGRKREGPFEMSAGVPQAADAAPGSVGSRDFISSKCSPGKVVHRVGFS